MKLTTIFLQFLPNTIHGSYAHLYLLACWISDGLDVVYCILTYLCLPYVLRNGRWRSQWTVKFPEGGGSAELSGLLKVQVSCQLFSKNVCIFAVMMLG